MPLCLYVFLSQSEASPSEHVVFRISLMGRKACRWFEKKPECLDAHAHYHLVDTAGLNLCSLYFNRSHDLGLKICCVGRLRWPARRRNMCCFCFPVVSRGGLGLVVGSSYLRVFAPIFLAPVYTLSACMF